jgi:hypothetical protein
LHHIESDSDRIEEENRELKKNGDDDQG